MNRDDVIRMAREAFIKRGFWPNEIMWECWKDAWIAGAAAEREAFPNLTAVINWLENGCDPKEAAKELRLYAAIRARRKHD